MDKQPILDDLFAKACQQEPVVSFNETKAQFLKGIAVAPSPSFASRLRHFLTFKKWIIMFTLFSTIALTVFIASTNEATQEPISLPQKTVTKPTQTTSGKSVPDCQLPSQQTPHQRTASESGSQLFLSGYENGLYANLPSLPLVNRTLPEANEFRSISTKPDDSVTYVFPKLTEKEIVANHKQKKSMLKALAKLDQKNYSYFPSVTVDYESKQVSLQSFYVQTTEVTNLEYRTFLFDLLIQNRKDDFLVAKPDQAAWTEVYGEGMKPMEDQYFSHPAYNHYPVVNISRAGAELYCKWFTEEYNKLAAKKNYPEIQNIRIPTRPEWIYAATVAGKQQPYPWNGNEVRNAAGCYLANFKPEPENFHVDGAFHTAKVDSYNPSARGLYCLSGNVSEMVYSSYTDHSNPGTAGGNWTSTAEEIKLLADDPYAGVIEGKPTIGFRVVMTHLGR
jgi:formylglycine-generating enzyme required for sulfatase activity